MFNKYVQACQSEGSKYLHGAYVWRLYDIYGFPIDLTKLIAEEQGLHIKDEEVSAAQENARETSRGEKKVNSQTTVHDLASIALRYKTGLQ